MNKKTLILASSLIVIVGIAGMSYINLRVAKHPAAAGSIAITSEAKEISQDVKKADLAFEKGGKVVFIAKQVGDEVKAGEILAKINNADALVAYNQAKAGVIAAQANLAATKNSLSAAKLRKKELESTDKKIQEKQVSLIENTIVSQEALLSQAQEALVNAQNQLDKYSLKAPFDGVLTLQNIEMGEVVTANVPVISVRTE